MQYLGDRFQIGAEGPKEFDCSGLVYRAFSDAGELPRIGGMRLRAAGYMQYFVSRGRFTKDESQAQRGDLVIYDNGVHIGIYLGDGKVISALINPWGVSIHSLHGIHLPVSYFLHVNWGGGDSGDPGDPDTGRQGGNGTMATTAATTRATAAIPSTTHRRPAVAAQRRRRPGDNGDGTATATGNGNDGGQGVNGNHANAVALGTMNLRMPPPTRAAGSSAGSARAAHSRSSTRARAPRATSGTWCKPSRARRAGSTRAGLKS